MRRHAKAALTASALKGRGSLRQGIRYARTPALAASADTDRAGSSRNSQGSSGLQAFDLGLVPGVGFEPTRPLRTAEFKSATTANSVTRAVGTGYCRRTFPYLRYRRRTRREMSTEADSTRIESGRHCRQLFRLAPPGVFYRLATVVDHTWHFAVERLHPWGDQLADRIGITGPGICIVGVEALDTPRCAPHSPGRSGVGADR